MVAQLREVGRAALAQWLQDAQIGRALVRGEFFRDGIIQEGGCASTSDPRSPADAIRVTEDSPEQERQAYAVHWARVDLAYRYPDP